MEIGYFCIGDLLPDPATGRALPQSDRFGEFIRMGQLTEELGFDVIHFGEHHFSDYVLSSPPIVMAALAQATSRIRLSTAATLLPHLDPVRVAEDYATVDILSGGRAELIGGRGIYDRHYAHFGQDAADGPALLEESITLLRRLWTERDVVWSGKIRPPLNGVTVYPYPVQKPHPPIWISASSPDSVMRAVRLGVRIMIPTVSTGKDLPAELAHLYRSEWKKAGRNPADAAVGLHVHFYVAEGDTQSIADWWRQYHIGYMEYFSKDIWGPETVLPPHLGELATPVAQAVCGNVDYVTRELNERLEAMGGADRLLIQTDHGGLPFGKLEGSLRLFKDKVLPRIREAMKATA